jgi:hypothetical protein
VKPSQGLASGVVHLYLDLLSLRRAFVQVLHSPMLCSSTEA